MQDGFPAHTSFLSKLNLQKICSYLKFWPTNSPDMNPIENLLGAMKRILKIYKISSKLLLLKVYFLILSFNNSNSPLVLNTVNGFVLSFKKRLIMCKSLGKINITFL